jgi:hypothetical protein
MLLQQLIRFLIPRYSPIIQLHFIFHVSTWIFYSVIHSDYCHVQCVHSTALQSFITFKSSQTLQTCCLTKKTCYQFPSCHMLAV